ncbi:hypothetical protein FC90_GL000206 [Latilactobacillus graminis DSM 20719]|uniref:Uncharacterized protein n=1 Tax=Latilactobacillus graminis DSM 20719 TaxID=1423752 RepID=A0AA89L4V5_9LACO|nr:hypothetical protein FC90_GL000206 [Latilactobacillus graminis DSM 20719]
MENQFSKTNSGRLKIIGIQAFKGKAHQLVQLTSIFSLTILMNSAYFATIINFLGFNLDFRDENA